MANVEEAVTLESVKDYYGKVCESGCAAGG